MTPPRPRPREWPREHLELRVDPEPVRPCCPHCGDEIFAGEYRDPATGRCALCVGRTTSLLGCASVVALVVTAALAIALVGWLATPRGASGPDSPQALALPSVPSGAVSTPNPAVTRTEALGEMVGAARRISGTATWYCLSGSSVCTRGYGQDDLVAAIDTDLGFAKGDRILVTYGKRSVVVTVVDVCGCPGDRLVDLTSGAFRQLAELGLGVIPVTIELAGPAITLPPTTTEEDL